MFLLTLTNSSQFLIYCTNQYSLESIVFPPRRRVAPFTVTAESLSKPGRDTAEFAECLLLPAALLH